MAHRIVTTATLRGDGATNQDHAVVTEHAAAVLDGATSRLPHDPRRDGGWFARTLGAALTPRLDDDSRSLPDVVEEALIDLRDRHDLNPRTSPTSTVSLARWTSRIVDVYVLGDGPAVVRRTDGSVDVLLDDRLAAAAEPTWRAVRDHLAGGRGYDARCTELTVRLQRALREARNTDGGYWIAGAEPVAARQGLSRAYQAADVASVLLLSDGAAAGVTVYGLADWPALLDTLENGCATRFLREVHATERADPDGARWPRFKRHDDKTLVFRGSG